MTCVIRPVSRVLHASLLVFVVLVIAGCDSTSVSNEAGDEIVVEAFLFAGEPVDDIRLTKVLALDAEDLTQVPVTNASVTLTKSGVRYGLEHTSVDGNYSYLGSDLSVEQGDVFELEVLHGDRVITSETTVPRPPENLELSDVVLGIPQIGIGGGPGGRRRPDQSRFESSLTLTWSNPNADHHYVVVEDDVEGEPNYILPEFIRERFEGFQFITQPTTENFYDIRILDLEIYGGHRAILYRVNEEYANLYQNREQDSRDLNEPPSNIEGALGVFSAFNSVAQEFRVVVSEE
jgi:hypothetical protein